MYSGFLHLTFWYKGFHRLSCCWNLSSLPSMFISLILKTSSSSGYWG